MARAKDNGGLGNDNERTKGPDTGLTLVRVEPMKRKGISLIFSSKDGERAWRLENASVMEFIALLLHGRMQRGRRVMLHEAELWLEPPTEPGQSPTLCMATGPLELCATVDRAGAKALKADIEHALKRPG